MTKTTVAVATFLIALSAPAFGQAQARKTRLTPMDVTVPDDSIPPMQNAAIIVDGGVNEGTSRNARFITSDATGQYQFYAILDDGIGTKIPIGIVNYPVAGSFQNFPLLSGNTLNVLPMMNQVGSVEVIQFTNGQIFKLSATCGPYDNQAAGFDLQSGADQFVNGQYTISLGGATNNLTSVAVGLYGIASKVVPSQFGGAIAIFPQNFYPQTSGTATITICEKGQCYTDTYRPKAVPTDDDKG